MRKIPVDQKEATQPTAQSQTALSYVGVCLAAPSASGSGEFHALPSEATPRWRRTRF
jgi:hypothetical protein